MDKNKTINIPRDGFLRKNLDDCKGAVKQDWDMIFVVDGMEGSGKSVLAQQCAWYCDNTLDLSRIVFTAREFMEVVTNAAPFQSVIYDEAYGGLSSRQTMSRTNQAIVKMLAEIRQKNLFVFIVLPTFFDLDKYVAVWRSRALIHVYTKGFERGKFTFFAMDRKKMLYMNGKKFYSYNCIKANFHGEFGNNYVVPEEEYRKLKLDALKRYTEEAEKEDKSWILEAFLVKNKILTITDISRITKIPKTTVTDNVAKRLQNEDENNAFTMKLMDRSIKRAKSSSCLIKEHLSLARHENDGLDNEESFNHSRITT